MKITVEAVFSEVRKIIRGVTDIEVGWRKSKNGDLTPDCRYWDEEEGDLEDSIPLKDMLKSHASVLDCMDGEIWDLYVYNWSKHARDTGREGLIENVDLIFGKDSWKIVRQTIGYDRSTV